MEREKESVSDFVRDYEFRGETDYRPTDQERELIEDAIHGYLAEISAEKESVVAAAGAVSGHYRFAQLECDVGDAASINLADDPRLAFLACRIADQQRAGFRDYLDLRQLHCPDCNAPGFNTGWGVWAFLCGAELHPDGEPAELCGATGAKADPTGEG